LRGTVGCSDEGLPESTARIAHLNDAKRFCDTTRRWQEPDSSSDGSCSQVRRNCGPPPGSRRRRSGTTHVGVDSLTWTWRCAVQSIPHARAGGRARALHSRSSILDELPSSSGANLTRVLRGPSRLLVPHAPLCYTPHADPLHNLRLFPERATRIQSDYGRSLRHRTSPDPAHSPWRERLLRCCHQPSSSPDSRTLLAMPVPQTHVFD
jgi:hypothetical protein